MMTELENKIFSMLQEGKTTEEIKIILKADENIEKIVKNFEPEVKEFNGNKDQGYNVLVGDKNSKFEVWVDVWIDEKYKDVSTEWNQFIFHDTDSKDIFQQKMQDNDDIADMVWGEAVNYLQEKGIIKQDDSANWYWGDTKVQSSKKVKADDNKEKVDFTKEVKSDLGKKLAYVLLLNTNEKGRYDTTWGDKTEKGLEVTVKRFIEDGLSGNEIADILMLKTDGTGKYVTGWGNKTAIGLVETLKKIVNDGIKGSTKIKVESAKKVKANTMYRKENGEKVRVRETKDGRFQIYDRHDNNWYSADEDDFTAFPDNKEKVESSKKVKAKDSVQERLEYLREQINNENISYEEIAELQSLAKYIDPSDVQLLEWAGVDEFGNDKKGKVKADKNINKDTMDAIVFFMGFAHSIDIRKTMPYSNVEELAMGLPRVYRDDKDVDWGYVAEYLINSDSGWNLDHKIVKGSTKIKVESKVDYMYMEQWLNVLKDKNYEKVKVIEMLKGIGINYESDTMVKKMVDSMFNNTKGSTEIKSDERQLSYRDFDKAQILKEQTYEEAQKEGNMFSESNIEARDKIQSFFEKYDKPYGARINVYDEQTPKGLVPLKSFEPFYNFSVDILVPDYDEELNTLLKQWLDREDSRDIEKISSKVDQLGGVWLYWE